MNGPESTIYSEELYQNSSVQSIAMSSFGPRKSGGSTNVPIIKLRIRDPQASMYRLPQQAIRSHRAGVAMQFSVSTLAATPPNCTESVEPRTLTQGPPRPTENVPRPTPFLARAQGTTSLFSDLAVLREAASRPRGQAELSRALPEPASTFINAPLRVLSSRPWQAHRFPSQLYRAPRSLQALILGVLRFILNSPPAGDEDNAPPLTHRCQGVVADGGQGCPQMTGQAGQGRS
jgi:hypothetical protein